MLVFAILKFGRLPVYGLDPDPYSLSIDWLNFIGLIGILASFFTIPATILLSIHLIINKVKFERSDIIAIIISLSSIGMFFISKHFMSEQFLWIMD
jgi:hypothetical protein